MTAGSGDIRLRGLLCVVAVVHLHDALDAVTTGDAAENKMQMTLTYLQHSARPFVE